MKEQSQQFEEPLQFRTDQVETEYVNIRQTAPALSTSYGDTSAFARTSQRREITRNSIKDQQPFRNQKQNQIIQKQFQLKISPNDSKYKMTASFAGPSQIKRTEIKTSRSVKYPSPTNRSVYKKIKIETTDNNGEETFDRKQGVSERGNTVRVSQLDYGKILTKSEQTISELQQIIRNLRRGSHQTTDWRAEETRTVNSSQRVRKYDYEKTDMIAEIESLLSMIQSNRLRTSSRGYYQGIESSELRESRKEQELKLQLEATVSNLTVSTQRLEWQNRELLAANEKLIGILKRDRYHQDSATQLQRYTKYEREILELRGVIQNVTAQLEKVQADYEEVQNNFRLYIEEGNGRNSQNYRYVEIIETLRFEKQELSRNVASRDDEIQGLRKRVSQTQNSKSSAVSAVPAVPTGPSTHSKELIVKFTLQIDQQRARYEKIIAELNQKIQIAQSKYVSVQDFRYADNTDTDYKIREAIQIYKKENEMLRSTNTNQNGQIRILTQENSRLRNQLIIVSTNHTEASTSLKFISEECEKLRVRCINLEKSVSVLTQEIQKLRAVTNDLQRQKWQVEQQKVRLGAELNRLRNDVGRQLQLRKTIEQLNGHINNIQTTNVELQFKLDEANGKLASEEGLHRQQIAIMQQEITFKNQQISIITERLRDTEGKLLEKTIEVQKWFSLYDRLSKDRVSITYQTLEGELKELRAMIAQFDLKKIGKFEAEAVEEYHRLSYQHELKIEQNLKLRGEIEQLKGLSLSQQSKNLQLTEHVSQLQSNVDLYERSLKERRALYDQLLVQKSRMQKEIFVSRKIKMEKSDVEQEFKFNVGQITARIDHVLDLERERTVKWQQYDRAV